ncbi:Glucose-1-phosphate adenylyltransferase [bioreactor metagenome]|uniref:Glucose-1-phosphate adenylyltransferase n=1 Tax=bioreactor metagenome TaxID=1076179 RepID=A0A644TS12_9ZZZZ|nr:glucose-1-phosphate adenylyltransferase [Negativicutes bacterium]
MPRKECVAMLLAGGQGSRLGILTKKLAKPAVLFGGKYRIIDFALSNCNNSGINTVGVLTQYKPLALNSYIGIGAAWDLDRKNGGVYVLPPYVREQGGEWYKGTADAICQNMNFIDSLNPEYVLVLSGDHIYKMDYSEMIKFHVENKADATIAVIAVPWEEASRFGIMNTASDRRITEFVEKPRHPQSNLASMGIYIFNWQMLRQYLVADEQNQKSSHDFGKDVIPQMLEDGQKMYAFPFSGYWKDVGTVDSYWEANMDLLAEQPELDIHDPAWRIYSVNPTRPPHYLGPDSHTANSIISEGCLIYGEVEHSVIFPDVYIGPGARVKDSIIMSHVRIEANATVDRAIIDQQTVVGEDAIVAGLPEADGRKIIVIGENVTISSSAVVDKDVASDQQLAAGSGQEER